MSAGLIFSRDRMLADLRDRLDRMDRHLTGLHPQHDRQAIDQLTALRNRTADQIQRLEAEPIRKSG